MDPMEDFQKYINAYSRYHQGILDPGDPTAGQYVINPETGKREQRPWTEPERLQAAVVRETLQLATAIPFRLSYEEFKFLFNEVEQARSQFLDGSISEAVYQEQLWSSLEKWEEQREDQPHYSPTRTDDGQPIDWDPNDPKGMQNRLAGARASDPAIAPVIESAKKGELASILESINASKPTREAAVEAFTATKAAQQSAPVHQMDLSELAAKSDKQLNNWLLDGKLLTLREAPPDSFHDMQFGGHSVGSIQNAPPGQRDSDAIQAWIDGMRAAHAKQVADAQQANVAAAAKASILQDVAGHTDQRSGNPPVINPPEAVQALASGMESEESSSGAADAGSTGMDAVHMGLDAVGLFGDAVVPGAGVVADGANALLYLGRAATDPENAGDHLKNALISGVSMIPFVGDAAKAFKYSGKALQGVKAAKAARAEGRGLMDTAGAFLKGGGAEALTKRAIGGSGDSEEGALADGGGAGGGSGGSGGPAALPGSEPGGTASQQATDTVESIFGAVGGFVKKLGPAAVVIGAATLAFKGLVDWLNKVDETSKKIIQENRELAQYSGVTAAAYAQLDRDRLGRTLHASEEMSGPLSRLTAAQSRNEDAWEHLLRPFDKFGTEIQALKTEVSAAIVSIIDTIEPIGKIIEWWYGEQKDDKQERNAAEAISRWANNIRPKRKF